MVMGDTFFAVDGDGNSQTFPGGGPSTCADVGETDLECQGFSTNDTTGTSFLFHDLHLTVSDPRAPTGAPTAMTLTAIDMVVFAEGGFQVGVWVPEPGSAALLLSGLLSVAALRRGAPIKRWRRAD